MLGEGTESTSTVPSSWNHTRKFKQRAWFGDAAVLVGVVGVARDAVTELIDQRYEAAPEESRDRISEKFDRDIDKGGRGSLHVGIALRPRIRLDGDLVTVQRGLDEAVGPIGGASFILGSESRGNLIHITFYRQTGVNVKLVGPERWVATTEAKLRLELRKGDRKWSWAFSNRVYLASSATLALLLIAGLSLSVISGPLSIVAAFVGGATLMIGQLLVPRFEVMPFGRQPKALTFYRVVGGILGTITLALVLTLFTA